MTDSNSSDKIPRELRTPITEAGEIISYLCDWFVELNNGIKSPENAEQEFLTNIFGAMFRDETTSGDEAVKGLYKDLEKHCANGNEENFPYALLYAAFIACAYCVEGIKAEKQLKHQQAWTLIVDAQHWASIVRGHWLEKQFNSISVIARRAAHVRHAENREIAARIMFWYEENHDDFRSLDKAAEAVIKIEPVSFRTARKHIGEAAKKLRPARKE